MATLSTALNTPFTPASGTFGLQVTGGAIRLEKRGTSGAAWAKVAEIYAENAALIDNPIAGADYRMIAIAGSPVVQADQ